MFFLLGKIKFNSFQLQARFHEIESTEDVKKIWNDNSLFSFGVQSTLKYQFSSIKSVDVILIINYRLYFQNDQIQTMATNITSGPFMVVTLPLIPMGYLSLTMKTLTIMTYNGLL
jgi:hypothetical protein